MEKYVLVKTMEAGIDASESNVDRLVWLMWWMDKEEAGRLINLAVTLYPVCQSSSIMNVTFRPSDPQPRTRCVERLYSSRQLAQRTKRRLEPPSRGFWEDIDVLMAEVGRNMVLANEATADLELARDATLSTGLEIVIHPLMFRSHPDLHECAFILMLEDRGSEMRVTVRELFLMLRFLLARDVGVTR